MTIYDKYKMENINAAKRNAYNSVQEGIEPELIYQTMERLLPEATKEEMIALIFDSIVESGGVSGNAV